MTKHLLFCSAVYLENIILGTLGLFEKTSGGRLLVLIPDSNPMREKS